MFKAFRSLVVVLQCTWLTHTHIPIVSVWVQFFQQPWCLTGLRLGILWFCRAGTAPPVGADPQKKKKKKIKLVTISIAEKPALLVVFKCGVKGDGCKIYWCWKPSPLIGRSAWTICSLERHWATAWPIWHNWGETGQKILFSPILFHQSGLTNSAEWEAGTGGEGGKSHN